jgi:hypothetical protein
MTPTNEKLLGATSSLVSRKWIRSWEQLSGVLATFVFPKTPVIEGGVSTSVLH